MSNEEYGSIMERISRLKSSLKDLDCLCWKTQKMLYDLEEKVMDERYNNDSDLNKFLYNIAHKN